MPKGIYQRTESGNKNMAIAAKVRQEKMWLDPEYRKRMVTVHTGKKYSQEHGRHTSEGLRMRYISNPNLKKQISEKMKGAKGNNWKGGRTSIHKLIRVCGEMQAWRKAVFERDNYTCVWCGGRNGEGVTVTLNADHIYPFAHFPKLRFSIENGRTLCTICHKKTRTYGVKATQWFKESVTGDEKEKLPPPEDEEMDAMYDSMVGSESKEYHNAH